ncbi:hypothetical protein BC831DRAFT_473269 [Entophlyctis helioformis]|nr:hypothetical protein BC831DRAFT_473168 [Entophlyctis helioformis]KAI8923043.1 hypothetical protein BC831DRAFT_473269 [Entophlyctis helioformis]
MLLLAAIGTLSAVAVLATNPAVSADGVSRDVVSRDVIDEEVEVLAYDTYDADEEASVGSDHPEPIADDADTVDAADTDEPAGDHTDQIQLKKRDDGQLDCAAVSEAYGLIPYRTWGTTPNETRPLWDDQKCNQQMCQHWKDKYQVDPLKCWGSLPEEYKTTWMHPYMRCDLRAGPYNDKQCRSIAEDFDIVPFISSAANTPDYVKTLFEESECGPSLCQYWKEKHGVKPFGGFGSLPPPLQRSWLLESMQCDFRAGPYNSQQCTRASEVFGIVPFVTWGTAPDHVKQHFEYAGCAEQLCTYWAKKYNVKPLESYGTLPADLQTSWNNRWMNCALRVGPFTQKQCETVASKYEVYPYRTMGRTPSYIKPLYNSSDCEPKVCQYYKNKNNIEPYVSWGNASAWMQLVFGKNCMLRVGPYNDKQCIALAEKYGLIPYHTWGTTPSEFRPLWDAAKCNQRMCEYWRDKYHVTKTSMGSLPTNLTSAWNHSLMQCSACVA